MKSQRVLLVEDESIVAMDMERRLRGLGYAVVGRVLTGQDAIEKAEQEVPDVVLMDIHLKGEMDGIEAAEHIQRTRQIPIIYITAYSDQATLERAKETEPYGYILKPFQEREIHSVIEMALYKHRAEQELVKAKIKAEEGLRAKNVFLSNMSHEFLTPLNTILGISGLAEEIAQRNSCEELQEYIKMISEAGKELHDMVGSVLAFSRLESDGLDEQERYVSPVSFLKRLRDRFSYKIAQKGLSCLLRINAGVPEKLLCPDESYLMIFHSLLSNAVKFTEKGEVSFLISYEHQNGAADRLRVTISDTGIGVSEERKGEIFDAFQQADNSSTRMYGGAGLGLSIVKRTVDQAGGELEWKSVEGQGSDFVVYLPVSGFRGAASQNPFEMLLGKKRAEGAMERDIDDFVKKSRAWIEEGLYQEIEKAAEQCRQNSIGYMSNSERDLMLRVLLGARKASYSDTKKALERFESLLQGSE